MYEKEKNDKYMDILAGYASSIFRGIESNLRTENDLVDAIRLVSDESKSNSVTYKITLGL